MELAAGDDAVTGDCRTVIDGAGTEVDPEEAVGGGEESAGASGDGGGRDSAGGVGVSVGFVRVRIGGNVEEIKMVVIRVRVRG